ncbi:MAG: hypothetical protein H6517_00700 [Microthrixaceae bacterium]|nr:hypothetical protein [Microthrixaceae bacterium]MCB1010723.1 hypothetical protein [Microthrixaceae bacterium]MCB9386326.1 hypothetical protein [Microthrixaceae bacterium]MCO5320951.1 hypothetical protein [Microthrixaceae bacterium]
MAAESDVKEFKAHQKVVASVDLDEVPAGTRGKVMLRTGFSWVRYRVRFDNGVEVPWLDDRHLVGAKEYDRSLKEESQ